MLNILYRISDSSNPKDKLPNATKAHCLENCISVFGLANIRVFADHCSESTRAMVRQLGLKPLETALGNAGSWRFVLDYAFNQFHDSEAIYFVEDDYLHVDTAPTAITEGLQIADYVTLYDHPDKYKNANDGGPNPYVNKGGEVGRIFLTSGSHWKQTNSTTMTFAAQVKTLKEDRRIWEEFTSEGFPNDFEAFQRLQSIGAWENRIFGKNRLLVSSIPGLSTHCETAWLSPLTDWKKI